MAVRLDPDPIVAGHQALAGGDWKAAHAAFTAATAVDDPSAEALDGLGLALWWNRRTREAVVRREQAYAAYRRRGELSTAAHLALWLATEQDEALANPAAANGWLRRAEGLAQRTASERLRGWVLLTRAGLSADPESALRLAQRALDVGCAENDADLELRAMARVGLCEVLLGRVDTGLGRFDEAMAAAGAEPARGWETFGMVCCMLVRACEVAGDTQRMTRWAEAVTGFLAVSGHLPLLAFCGSCCGEMFLATGAWEAAEGDLDAALAELEAAGETGRCVHPAARLAELRVLQGRLEEAEALLSGREDMPEALRPRVMLHHARNEHATALTLLRRRLAGGSALSLLHVPLLALEVVIACEAAEIEDARAAAKRLAALAESSGLERVHAEAALAAGRVAAADSDPAGALHLERAQDLFTRLGMPHGAAHARLELARWLTAESAEAAAAEARIALTTFEELGATRDADAAASLLRAVAGTGRSGPRGGGQLTRREVEVLRLVAYGLTNREIAERLFISPKTAGNHVSAILAKLDLRNRAEAAASAHELLTS